MISVTKKIFNRKFDLIILDEERLGKRIFLLDDVMTKAKTELELSNADMKKKILKKERYFTNFVLKRKKRL